MRAQYLATWNIRHCEEGRKGGRLPRKLVKVERMMETLFLMTVSRSPACRRVRDRQLCLCSVTADNKVKSHSKPFRLAHQLTPLLPPPEKRKKILMYPHLTCLFKETEFIGLFSTQENSKQRRNIDQEEAAHSALVLVCQAVLTFVNCVVNWETTVTTTTPNASSDITQALTAPQNMFSIRGITIFYFVGQKLFLSLFVLIEGSCLPTSSLNVTQGHTELRC